MPTGKKFKIVYGYGEADYISITENQLATAISVFMEGGRAIFNENAIRGQDIMRIVPDWHAEKGWNKGYKMIAEDYADIKPLERDYQDIYNKAKYLAEYSMKENRRDLLSQPLEEAVKVLPKNQVSEEIK